MNVVVQDTSTIVNLLRAGLMQRVVVDLGLRVPTTDLVAHEVASPREAFLEAVACALIEVTTPIEDEVEALASEQRGVAGLTLQDLSVVWLARMLKCPLLSSDGRLRRYAQECSVTVHGELWLLDRLVGEGCMAPQDAAHNSYYSGERLCRDVTEFRPANAVLRG